jgi:hypothetical protein
MNKQIKYKPEELHEILRKILNKIIENKKIPKQ